jgi:probable rRNA maturation factor
MLARFLSRAQAAAGVRDQVTVLLTTDSTMRRLNRRFRGKNKATDVLSFPADRSAPGAKKIAGDLAIGVPMARRQAAEHGHSLAVEIKVLILHGLLHLAGYDHETDSGRMGRREQVLRDRLGLPLGLIERAGNFAGSNRKAESRADGSFGFVPSQVRRKNMNAPNLRHPASRGNRQVEDGRS